MSCLKTLNQLYYAVNPKEAIKNIEYHRYQAKLAEMEYTSKRKGYLPILRMLRSAPDDFVFLFKDGSKRILSKEQRTKDRRKITRYLANVRSAMFSELEEIKSSGTLMEPITNILCAYFEPLG